MKSNVHMLKIKLIDLLIHDGRLKPLPRRVDNNFFNYYSTCALKYAKQVLRCKECNQKVRTKPWHRTRITKCKRI